MNPYFIAHEISCHNIPLTRSAPYALLKGRRRPGNGKHVRVRDTVLHVYAGTHILGPAYKNTHLAVSHALKQLLALFFGVSLLDIGDFRTGYAVIVDETVYHVGVCVILFPLSGNAHLAEDKLHSALLRHFVIILLDVLAHRMDLPAAVIRIREYQLRTYRRFCR